MNAPKISVVVPIYNAGPYLKKRMDTLLNQALKEIEIILVLDCPTDGSAQIAETYAQQDNRIILVHNKTNLHIGLSRNEGLKRATGEYISFSDHDDYSEPDMFEKMYQKAKETEADVVVSDFWGQNGKQSIFYGFPCNYSDTEFQKKTLSCLIGGSLRKKGVRSLTSNGLIWNQIYRRDFLTTYKIFFQDNRKITFEDRIFLIEVYHFATKIVRLPEAFYHHIYYSGSAGSNYTFKSIDLVINYLLFLHHFLKHHRILERESINYSDSVLLTSYSAFRNELRHRSIRKSFQELSKIKKNSIIQQALYHFFKPKNIHYLKKYPITKICFLVLVIKFPKIK